MLRTGDGETPVSKGGALLRLARRARKLTIVSRHEPPRYLQVDTIRSPDTVQCLDLSKFGILLHKESSIK